MLRDNSIEHIESLRIIVFKVIAEENLVDDVADAQLKLNI